MEERIYTCSKWHYESKILPKYKRLLKKATKLNIAVELKVVREFVMEVKDHNDNIISFEAVDLVVTGDPVVISGWRVKARIEHESAGNLVMTYDMIPEHYRTADCNCDHCHVNRQRNTTYILQNVESGEYKQVGKTCLTEFLGINPSQVFVYESFEMDELNEEFESYGGQPLFNVESLLEISAKIIRKDGYTSRQKAEEQGRIPTSVLVCGFYCSKRLPENEPTAEDKEKAQIAVQWLKDNEDQTDYILNLKTIVSGKYVKEKHIGYLVSLIPAYERFLATQKEKEVKNPGQFLGTIGDKVTFAVTVKQEKLWFHQYGTTYFYIMETEEGNTITWKSSNGILEVNKTYNLKGTIKDHTEFAGVKQTELTRCKVVS